MPILTLQRRSRELGRIRIGQQVAVGTDGKTRPEKLDRFRLTSASRALLDKAAALYGGTVTEWTNGGATQYEVITTATRLPVLVPPQPVSQWYELWSGGGCQRRCDGEREVLTDQPCLCSPDPEDRACKPTTRLNVVLRDVEGVGVWRLESHGYYAATELPSTAEFLAQTSGYIQGWLSLEERVIKRNNQTRRFMVPTIEVDVTPAALMTGGGAPAALAAGAPPAAEPPAPPPAKPEPITVAEVRTAATLTELRALYERAKASGQTPTEELRQALTERTAQLSKPAPEQAAEQVATMANKAQLTKLHTLLTKCGVTKPDDRRLFAGALAHRELTSTSDLTSKEADKVINQLVPAAADKEPDKALDAVLASLDFTDQQQADGAP